MILKEFKRRIVSKSKFILGWTKSIVYGFWWRRRFNNLNCFCLFVGYPRSGHSLIASLLDAHPNVVVGMEWDVLSHFKLGYRKNQIFYSILRNSFMYHKRKNNTWTGYSYKVEDMWQGNFKTINLIGDKLGGRTSLILEENVDLIRRLGAEIRLPIHFIHVIRNPYDTISTMALRSFEKKGIHKKIQTIDLIPFVHGFFRRAEVVKSIKDSGTYQMFDLYHEGFVNDPKQILRELLNFFNLNVDEEYLDRCSDIVYEKPKYSRFNVDWEEDLISLVKTHINRFKFLQAYKFKE